MILFKDGRACHRGFASHNVNVLPAGSCAVPPWIDIALSVTMEDSHIMLSVESRVSFRRKRPIIFQPTTTDMLTGLSSIGAIRTELLPGQDTTFTRDIGCRSGTLHTSTAVASARLARSIKDHRISFPSTLEHKHMSNNMDASKAVSMLIVPDDQNQVPSLAPLPTGGCLISATTRKVLIHHQDLWPATLTTP
ncbi:hypothetical protein S40293_10370 [Stachybotrys chartarum IBT 40293]|nr:hypothetical protein S40293_10370 [Stachybotrys chartarum IBT 40293]